MKNFFRKTASGIKSRPNETKWSLGGLSVGAIAGLSIGGLGVATMGGAFGIPAAIVIGFVGVAVGNKIGSEKDRSKNSK